MATRKNNINPLRINGLNGRMLRLPSKKKREILVLYGQHASLERMSGLTEVLSGYGNVTVPDLPGFGGMDSLYKIGLEPSIDNFADYLAAFMKMQYKHRKVTIVAMSFSFLIVTRMLQKYPDIAKKVECLVSFAGFLHRDDFHVKSRYYWTWRTIAWLGRGMIGSRIIRYTILLSPAIRLGYRLVAKVHPKLGGADQVERKKRVDFEIGLWHCNDVRTRMKTLTAMLTADLCKGKVDLPVYHVSVTGDFYFDNHTVEQHMRIVYTDFEEIKVEASAHAPTVIATAKEASPFIPKRLRALLSM